MNTDSCTTAVVQLCTKKKNCAKMHPTLLYTIYSSRTFLGEGTQLQNTLPCRVQVTARGPTPKHHPPSSC